MTNGLTKRSALFKVKLEEHLKKHGLTQGEFAEQSGVSQSAISRLLTGEVKRIHSATAEKLAKALDIPPLHLTAVDTASTERTSLEIPPPIEWTAFEDFSLDLWRILWKDPQAQKTGRRGQIHGVDIIGRPGSRDKWHGLECKFKSPLLGRRLTRRDIHDAMKRARLVEPRLSALTIATTASRDARLQEYVRHLKTPFPVAVVFWEEILGHVSENFEALRHHFERWSAFGPKPTESTYTPEVDVTCLPSTGEHFLGRLTELQQLDDVWADAHVHVLSIVALGGIGKTALVKRWLDEVRQEEWRGAKRVFGWTFYSQGANEDEMTSAEPFFGAIYEWLGEEMPTGVRERGLRLAELLRERKTLLYLDGLEPLQHPPGHGQEGRLRDQGLRAFLKAWATAGNGLCVVTTREKLTDLKDAGGAKEQQLEELEPDSAVALLKILGTPGADSDLRAAAKQFGYHALALNLLGNYLRRTGKSAARVSEIDFGKADKRQGSHAFRVMHAYEKWLQPRELQVLRLLGLFDRPAPGGAVVALRQEPTIEGLTDRLAGLDDEDWTWSVSALRDHGLLLGADATDPEALDAHPLVREYFDDRLQENEKAWRAGHHRLYDFYKQAAPEFPDTFQEMLPLYAAVFHGCRAGSMREVLREVYQRRIRRLAEAFSIKKLGALGTELNALNAFFDRPWDRPSAQLREEDRSWLLNQAGFVLRALGRLVEAVEPMRAGLELLKANENWQQVAASASNLCELTLSLGEVVNAVATGEESVRCADESEDGAWRMLSRVTLANALHQAGRCDDSAVLFREAEALQQEWQPAYPRLYSLQGYRYCDLLLDLAEPKDGSGLDGIAKAVARGQRRETERFRQACEAVRERAEEALGTAEAGDLSLLTFAIDHLSLGRAHLGLALTTQAGGACYATAANHLDQAVVGLWQAADEEMVARGLLARATSRRLTGDLASALADLDEALEIAERGSMRLQVADIHLERTRLHLFQLDDPAAARACFEVAQRIVMEFGYGRRNREVRWLGERLREAGETSEFAARSTRS